MRPLAGLRPESRAFALAYQVSLMEFRPLLQRMIEAVKDSLDYFTESFGPYQHRQVRIVEFPRYARFAQSFPNTIPFSESIGFIARLDEDLAGLQATWTALGIAAYVLTRFVQLPHVSVVFLAGDRAYKVKKSVRMPFLDYSTAQRRLRFCDQEVRLNRRLAPDVYLGVVPLVLATGGFIFFNTNVVNDYHDADARAARRAEYERRYGRYERAVQPRVAGTRLHVEIYPGERAVAVRGTFRLVNRSDVAIDTNDPPGSWDFTHAGACGKGVPGACMQKSTSDVVPPKAAATVPDVKSSHVVVPPKNILANCWLTTATGGAPARSRDSNPRPATIRIPMASK